MVTRSRRPRTALCSVLFAAANSVVLAVAMLACAGTPGEIARSAMGSRPDWVQRQPSETSRYPQGAYVTGVGTGPDLESARQDARAEISRLFQANVEAEFRSHSHATMVEQGGQTITQAIEEFEIDTKVTSTGTFEGVRIAETWHDVATGSRYALAVLEKAQMREVLLGQLRSAADRAHSDLVRADTAPTYLGRGKALLDSVRSRMEVDAIVARARLVGRPSVTGLPDTGEIERDLAQTLWNTRFQVRAVEIDAPTGAVVGGLPKLEEELAKTITGFGFKTVGSESSTGTPNVWLQCRVSLQQIDRELDAFFVRWEGACALTGPPPSGAVVLSAMDSGGESFSTPGLARTRAIMKGSAKLSRELEAQISRYLSER